MNVLVVFNHPYERSFCSAILDAVKTGLEAGNHHFDLIHLDQDEFDPVMRSKDLKAFSLARNDPDSAFALLDPQVLEYKDRIQKAEHIVFIFPIWWELMPARMKGFVDKVIFPGIAYKYSGGSGAGMESILSNLNGITLITTMGTPSLLYRLIFGNAIQRAFIRGTFWKIGVKNRKWISLANIKARSHEKRLKWLSRVEGQMRSL